MDIGGWLRGLGLERYEQAFRENEIDEKVLPGLTADDLKDLGVALVGHRRRLLDAIAALGAAAATAAATGAPRGTPAPAEAERRQLSAAVGPVSRRWRRPAATGRVHDPGHSPRQAPG